MSTLYSTVPHVTFDQFQFPCKKSKLLNHQVETRQTSTLFRFGHSAPSRAIQHTVKYRKGDFQTTHQEWCASSKENFCEQRFLNTKKCARSALETWGAFHSTKTFENLETEANGTEIVPEKFPEILKTVKFPKCEPFNEKF